MAHTTQKTLTIPQTLLSDQTKFTENPQESLKLVSKNQYQDQRPTIQILRTHKERLPTIGLTF
uniref:Fimbrin-1 n=1 Tax=Rhizophora mucronata TaxID=61149 RepID=A0A2P2LH98_RHIMU